MRECEKEVCGEGREGIGRGGNGKEDGEVGDWQRRAPEEAIRSGREGEKEGRSTAEMRDEMMNGGWKNRRRRAPEVERVGIRAG